MAQSATALSDTEISKDTENPVTRRITVPLRYEADFNDGAYKATKDTFSIDQAVVPFTLNEDWALITRTKLPAEALPKEAWRPLGIRAFQWIYDVFSIAGAWRGFLLGRRARPLLSVSHQLGARGQQMGLRPVGGIREGRREPMGVGCGRQQHLVVWRSASWH